MTPHVVVDVGNTRIKWGRCSGDSLTETCALPSDDHNEWQNQFVRWQLPHPTNWVVASVQPERSDRLVTWLRRRGDVVIELRMASQLPLRVLLEKPDHAGIDRLLDAVAANSRRRPDAPAILIDSGSAVTVDWLDESGAFAGGAILPGPRLMAAALHDHTALLPLIDPPRQPPALPGSSTTLAMEVGIFWTVAGGVRALCDQYSALAATKPDIFLTGGDGPVLHRVLGPEVHLWPTMTLDGIRITAEALP
jgi:type III pantothenate kinase